MIVKSYSNIDFSKRKKKRFIQTFFYMSSKIKNANALILCGPDIISHVSDFKIISPSISKTMFLHIAEIDEKVYKQNIIDLQYISNVNCKLYNTDVINCNVYRFVDLDFCKNLSSTIHSVDIVYKKMLKLKTKDTNNKHLLITFSLDRKGAFDLIDNIETLCILFGISNDFIKLDKLPNSNIMTHKTANCMYSTYRDGAPMCTFSYQW